VTDKEMTFWNIFGGLGLLVPDFLLPDSCGYHWLYHPLINHALCAFHQVIKQARHQNHLTFTAAFFLSGFRC